MSAVSARRQVTLRALRRRLQGSAVARTPRGTAGRVAAPTTAPSASGVVSINRPSAPSGLVGV